MKQYQLKDFDRWFKPCEKCGYDTAKTTTSSPARCWKCGNRIERDYTERALKKTKTPCEVNQQGVI